jgi:Holliday junction resolvasome RuvABC DNA-binding subunit
MNKKRVHTNKVYGYLKPKNEAYFKGFVKVNELGVSEAINIIFKDYFQRVGEGEKIKYLAAKKRPLK